MAKKKAPSKTARDILEEKGLNERGDEKSWENLERAKKKRRAGKQIRASDAPAREESATGTIEYYAQLYADDAKKFFDSGTKGADKIKSKRDRVHKEWQTDFKAKLQKSEGKTTERGFALQHASGEPPETIRSNIDKEKALLELAQEHGEPFSTKLKKYRVRYGNRK